MSLIHLFLLLGLLSLEAAASFSPGSRSILRDIGSNIADQKDNAIELNATNFDSVFQDSPAKYAVLEFFAHWCPACRNYKPHYEKVARLFNGADAVYPGVVLMTRVDCAIKMNVKLCDKFSINHYPMLFWAPPKRFVGGSWGPKQEKNEISVVDEWRTADLLLNWINKQIGSSYGLDDQKLGNLLSNISDQEQISQAIFDIEEATEEAFDIILAHKAIKSSETSASFIRFLQLLVAHHPSRRCRTGSAEILVNFDDICPSGECSYDQESGAKDSLRNFHICGKDVPRGYYRFCRGSKNETRGFSCGLWVLMHSLSVRIEDGESQFAFTAICDFINNFFMCDDCRRHFHDMCLSVKTPFKKARDIALWLWSTHNKVNERLKKDEDSLGTGDPKFPKMIWPPKQLCPSCYLSSTEKNIDWDHDQVYKFLKKYYGQKLVSVYKKNGESVSKEEVIAAAEEMAVPTNALVVPVGAALAIALASCAFGALACYWRTQQKNRKYNYNPHYLKRYNSNYMVMNTFSNTESEREKER
ncbi:Thioredoxin domain [Arabidopsis thaliana x Arabidopsis arenosa]|uniref:Sulfhydryl oxidase n=3 Tax=Arabidopsis TaxID=3701 RepID=A0A178W7Y5_ARATH|nr:Thioredoxin domain [Arabidopsis thaliana x Arabidopsis arenosa]KAG7654351.1 Thioredoxin domain [Arabidopsis suecica]OAP13645.1 QSOX1 [Arabidopsis thaliana]